MQRPRAHVALIALAALAVGVFAPAAGLAQESDSRSASDSRSSFRRGFDKGFDAAILRPVGALALVVGAGLFVPAAALASPGGMDPINEALDFFVLEPSHYVIDRPLGEF